MSLASATQTIRNKTGSDSGLDATIKFDLGADGVIVIDGESTPHTVSNDNTETDCTVVISLENLQALLDGKLDPASGFMGGKLRVKGDMAVAMRLLRLIEGQSLPRTHPAYRHGSQWFCFCGWHNAR
ncbi:MAG: SCP2 sterol-binding domain-containing protein [Rhodoferax sp.]|nr:SCP2 sterol-binding domain-containing protein [Rhodoferax sp.]